MIVSRSWPTNTIPSVKCSATVIGRTRSINLQTLKDNLRLFTPEILDRINGVIVRAGHRVLKKKPEEGVVGRCDSFVVETDVHFPTDINLLLDAIRKVIEISAELSSTKSYRDGDKQLPQRQFKRQYRKVQRLKHSTSKDETKNSKKSRRLKRPIVPIWTWRRVIWHELSKPANRSAHSILSLWPDSAY